MKDEACRGCNVVVATTTGATSTSSNVSSVASSDGIIALDGHMLAREFVSSSDTDDTDLDLGSGRLVIDLDASDSTERFGSSAASNSGSMKHSTPPQKPTGASVAGSASICSAASSGLAGGGNVDNVTLNKNGEKSIQSSTPLEIAKAQHRFLPKVAITNAVTSCLSSPSSNCIVSSRDSTPDKGLKMKIKKCNPSNVGGSTIVRPTNPNSNIIAKSDIPKFQNDVPKFQNEVPKFQNEVPKFQNEVPKFQNEVPKFQQPLLPAGCKPGLSGGGGSGMVLPVAVEQDLSRAGGSDGGSCNSKTQCSRTMQKKAKTSAVKDCPRTTPSTTDITCDLASASSSKSSSSSSAQSSGVTVKETIAEVIKPEGLPMDLDGPKKKKVPTATLR